MNKSENLFQSNMSMSKNVKRKITAFKIFIAIVLMVETFFFTDGFYSINTLVPVLQKYGIFSDYCETNAETTKNFTLLYPICINQDTQFGYTFIIWIIFQAICAVGIGMFFDYIGIKVTKICAGLFAGLGYLLFGLTQYSSKLIYFAGCLASVGSTCISITNIAISVIMNKNRNLLISIQCGLMISSSLVYLIVVELYKAGIDIIYSFSALCIFGLILIIGISLIFYKQTADEIEIQLLRLAHYNFKKIMITKKSENLGEKLYFTSDINILNDEVSIDADDEMKHIIISRERYLLIVYPTRFTALISRKFILISLFYILLSYRFVFFVSQLGLQLNTLFPDDLATINHLKKVSSIFLGLGVIFSVCCGFLTDRMYYSYLKEMVEDVKSVTIDKVSYKLDMAFIWPSLICNCTCLIASALVNINNIYLYYFIMVLFSITRAFNSSIVGAFIGTAYPIKYLGSLFGCIILVSGLLTASQVPLIQQSGPTGYSILINYILIICPILTLAHPFSLIFLK